ncbi:MAG: DUF5688 family protein [Agathobacter sp.]|nr:DUF5688 family protein [Agathobacter sp.]
MPVNGGKGGDSNGCIVHSGGNYTDFNHVQDKICYKLVNRDKNKELLSDAPYLPFHDLAVNVTGVNVSHISNIETNKVKVSLTLLVQICNALDVTIDYLLENEYHNPTSALEKELLNTVKDMPNDKRETLLRIAKVL